jgi:hypothetical protein
VESGEESQGNEKASPVRAKAVSFVIVSLVAIAILLIIGASLLLIVEVFGLAIILGVSAVMIIIVFGRSPRLRWDGRSRR